MLDFVDVKDRMPEDGAEVEVLRVVGYMSPAGYCRYAIARTAVVNGMFWCDMVSTGYVVLWRPAEVSKDSASVHDYPGLAALFPEAKASNEG